MAGDGAGWAGQEAGSGGEWCAGGLDAMRVARFRERAWVCGGMARKLRERPRGCGRADAM